MFELKPLSKKAVNAALEKAEHYRLLNEPQEAESICRDVLALDGDNQSALVTLILALTDRFGEGMGARFQEARDAIAKLDDEFGRAYYSGIISERRGKAHHAKGQPGCGSLAYEWLAKAMTHFEEAQALKSGGNDDPILRWNACARLIMSHEDLTDDREESVAPPLELE